MAISTPRLFRRESAGFADGFANAAGLNDVSGAELARGFNLAVVLDDGDDFATGERGDVEHHEAERAAADDGDGVAGMGAGIFESMDGAGERLSERGVLQRNVVGNVKRVLGDDARGDADELSVGAVVEEQIVAEILLAVLAEVTLAAGSGIQRHHAAAVGETFNSLACLDDGSGQLVAEEGRRDDHAGMVAAAKDFQVCSASEGSADANNQLAGGGPRNRHVFNANILAAVEDRGLHGSLAQLARGLDGIAADLNDLFNGAPANVEDFLDGIAADLEHIADGAAANLEDILDRRAAALMVSFTVFGIDPSSSGSGKAHSLAPEAAAFERPDS